MNRRQFVAFAAAMDANRSSPPEPRLLLPVHRATDVRAQSTSGEFRRFWRDVWPEAVRDLARCGIDVQTTDGTVEIRQSPAGRPVLVGLRPQAINVVLTGHVPMFWDNGRGLSGLTGMHDGHHISMIAIGRAHPHQAPLLAVNTVLHELLHLLRGDVFVSRPTRFEMQRRELRNDWLATRMWLFGGACAEVRQAAAAYLKRLLLSP